MKQCYLFVTSNKGMLWDVNNNRATSQMYSCPEIARLADTTRS